MTIATIPINVLAFAAANEVKIIGGSFGDTYLEIPAGSTVKIETTLSPGADIDAGTATFIGGANDVGPKRVLVAGPKTAMRLTGITANAKVHWTRR